ncbi:hypothetical protein [Candidatus Phycosocius spiralis]|uniref:Transporter n=1 Tax=Candidatus Phycosocius spiralis TaxID=2815099 RepID=A0ABQ4PSS4_9PROT|nr:hypothetical protein [Candidatus Phycosocius spiralis]GIU66052.1 hypothetical protein PsB1_0206 [Candidatus Phycosocius spiralis]
MRSKLVSSPRSDLVSIGISPWVKPILFGLAIGLQTFAGAANAQSQHVNNGTDPTQMVSKFISTYEHLDLKGGLGNDTLKFEYTLSLPNNVALGVKLPVTRLTGSGAGEHFDIGDASLTVAKVFGLSKQGGNVLVGEMIFDTAKRPELGAGHTSIKATYVRAIFLPTGNILAPSIVHQISIAGRKSRPDVNKSTFDLYFVPKLNDSNNLVTFDPSLVSDWEADKQYGALAITFGRIIGKVHGGNAIVSVKPTVFFGGDRPGDWGLEVGWKLIGF